MFGKLIPTTLRAMCNFYGIAIKADTNIIKVLAGRWKFVIMRSTTLKS